MTLARVIEALLFSAQKPLSIREMAAAIKGAGAEDESSPNEFARATESEIAAALEQLKIEYIQEQRAFQIIEKAEAWPSASLRNNAIFSRSFRPAHSGRIAKRRRIAYAPSAGRASCSRHR
jgi:chromosome segregation and condensation protein ScpB